MKIYFEDGPLFRDRPGLPYGKYIVDVDARNGYSKCKELLNKLKNNNLKETVVYTNTIISLNNDFAWNDELKVPEIYIRNKNKKFERIDKLTNKKLRQAHNIMRMYIAGAFDGENNDEEC